MLPHAYIPVDISRARLLESAQKLADEFPELQVLPICVDYSQPFELPEGSGKRLTGFFPGSSIGNFDRLEAAEFLSQVRDTLGPEGRLILGIDKRKDAKTLTAAYNDAAGVTATFNRNILAHLNQVAETNFNTEAFSHRAIYDAELGRIEMHLVSDRHQTVNLNGQAISIRAGEYLHTENSYKYSIAELDAVAKSAGWSVAQRWEDADGRFMVALLCPR